MYFSLYTAAYPGARPNRTAHKHRFTYKYTHISCRYLVKFPGNEKDTPSFLPLIFSVKQPFSSIFSLYFSPIRTGSMKSFLAGQIRRFPFLADFLYKTKNDLPFGRSLEAKLLPRKQIKNLSSLWDFLLTQWLEGVKGCGKMFPSPCGDLFV